MKSETTDFIKKLTLKCMLHQFMKGPSKSNVKFVSMICLEKWNSKIMLHQFMK